MPFGPGVNYSNRKQARTQVRTDFKGPWGKERKWGAFKAENCFHLSNRREEIHKAAGLGSRAEGMAICLFFLPRFRMTEDNRGA